jgi:hypothetical protein
MRRRDRDIAQAGTAQDALTGVELTVEDVGIANDVVAQLQDNPKGGGPGIVLPAPPEIIDRNPEDRAAEIGQAIAFRGCGEAKAQTDPHEAATRAALSRATRL